MVADWHRYFADVVISGDPGEIAAAARAANSALANGASGADAREAGKAEAKRYRAANAPGGPATPANTWAGRRPTATASGGDWPALYAGRLFTPPARWGWQAAELVDAGSPLPPPLDLGPQPVWVEPPHPDTGPLSARRAKAVRRVVVRSTLAVLLFLAFGVYQVTIEKSVSRYGGFNAKQVYGYLLPAAGLLLCLWVVSAANEIRRTTADLVRFRRPYLALRAAELERHQHALRGWAEANRRHEQQVQEARQREARQRNGPQWYPVHPAAVPTRVDVIGGDPARYGWACLLAMVGTSLLSRGHRLTVLDLTGQEVGGELTRLAAARGMDTRWAVLDGGSDFDVLAGLSTEDIADGLAHVLTDRPDATGRAAEQPHERALAVDVLRTVLTSLSGPVTFARLAAGLRVLRRGPDTEPLSPPEVDRLLAGIGDIDQNDWTGRQLRLWAAHCDVLHEVAPGGTRPLWTAQAVSLLAMPGGKDDRKDLVDRMLLRLAHHAMRAGSLHGTHLAVVGADRLGGAAVRALSEQARAAGVRLMLFLDQPQDDLEKIVGTGGAVCIMKMYNHKDANIAAEFIGRGYKFVVNQLSHQAGRTFSDGGGDSFSATTNTGSNSTQSTFKSQRGASDSRGHTWTANRTWSSAENIGTSTTTARVYEFITEPQAILGMDTTEFILVDSSGGGRQVVLANCYPPICLSDRVSPTPAPQRAVR
ncbi:hypothetical protein H4696_001962 [Amycolatopsis lexingtonensis]|uniref:TraD/TraG TraM recognition site domain-containing protein n=2 Tax=Amycolatopsis lexingtonensis TaxID=218822 RepID=A0ABR9HVD1_9PSEU|nr:hypothetical protein [Amycolatopsis lexingtonensis]MBE1494862.1 hypothetical protein [Amycolatopsis lexingtonensis]